VGQVDRAKGQAAGRDEGAEQPVAELLREIEQRRVARQRVRAEQATEAADDYLEEWHIHSGAKPCGQVVHEPVSRAFVMLGQTHE
jgi:hypothetical protein